MSARDATGGNKPETDILPIFVADYAYEEPPLIATTGTGFLVGRSVLVTCWHCVREELEGDLVYCALKQDPDEGYSLYPLVDIEQDPSGADLATALVNVEPEMDLIIAKDTWHPYGTDFWTFGYPLTDVEAHPDTSAGKRFRLHGRYMQSYTMRRFMNDWPGFGLVPSWELDMPALAGMSGAPIVRMGSREIIGVIYGHHEAETVEEFGSRDPETRERLTPEVVRKNYFATAHDTRTLQNLRGRVTEGQPLFEYLRDSEGSESSSEDA